MKSDLSLDAVLLGNGPPRTSTYDDPRLAFALSVARSLDAEPRAFDCRWLYDDEGSRLFELITEQPEYYPTRTEDRLLAVHAERLRARLGPVTLVELGAGCAHKTRHLLSAFCRLGPTRYVPVDVSAGVLAQACRRLASVHPRLTVEGLATSNEHALDLLGALHPLCLVFLGSSLGNLDCEGRARFLDRVAARLSGGDFVLLGLDLVKDVRRVEAAYNDAAGVSAAFTRNLFARMNRELGTHFAVEEIEHVAFYDERRDRIEIHARFARETRVDLPLVERSFRIGPGEMIRTEISTKFRVARFTDECARHGFVVEDVLCDPEQLFGLMLLRRQTSHSSPSDASRSGVELERVRRRTLALIAPLSDEDLRLQPDPLMSPLAWDLGHIASYEQQWLVPDSDGKRPDTCDARSTIDPLYDPLRHPRSERGALPLAGRTTLMERLLEVRRAALGALRSSSRTDEQRLVQMVAQHEAQHLETMLAALQLRADFQSELPFADTSTTDTSTVPPTDSVPDSVPSSVLVPSGPFLLGSDETYAYDNERPRHPVRLDAFRIDVSPVTNRCFLEFMQDGGYRRLELWSDQGRRWLQATQCSAPAHFVVVDGQWMNRRFGRLEPVDPDCPVVHVSWFEADAFARWRRCRLPTEAEWEKAAAWDPVAAESRRYPWGDEPPTADRANLDWRVIGPAPVGSYPRGRSAYGCHQLLGDVWEWTSSPFLPYPGFRSWPYREYSEVFFGDTYRVLRGGSFATLSVAARASFRNWDFPERRQIFAGFRCASDV